MEVQKVQKVLFQKVPSRKSRFAIWLPVSGRAARPVAEAACETPHGHGEAVMVVDDERPLVMLAEETLAGIGYEAAGFDSSLAALQAFRDNPQRFDLVLTDETMPDLTGTEFAREIRRLRPDIPVLLMSGYSSARLIERAHSAGVSEVLRKPLVSRDIARAAGARARGTRQRLSWSRRPLRGDAVLSDGAHPRRVLRRSSGPPQQSQAGSQSSVRTLTPRARDGCIDLWLRSLHGSIDAVLIAFIEHIGRVARFARGLVHSVLQQGNAGIVPECFRIGCYIGFDRDAFVAVRELRLLSGGCSRITRVTRERLAEILRKSIRWNMKASHPFTPCTQGEASMTMLHLAVAAAIFAAAPILHAETAKTPFQTAQAMPSTASKAPVRNSVQEWLVVKDKTYILVVNDITRKLAEGRTEFLAKEAKAATASVRDAAMLVSAQEAKASPAEHTRLVASARDLNGLASKIDAGRVKTLEQYDAAYARAVRSDVVLRSAVIDDALWIPLETNPHSASARQPRRLPGSSTSAPRKRSARARPSSSWRRSA